MRQSYDTAFEGLRAELEAEQKKVAELEQINAALGEKLEVYLHKLHYIKLHYIDMQGTSCGKAFCLFFRTLMNICRRNPVGPWHTMV